MFVFISAVMQPIESKLKRTRVTGRDQSAEFGPFRRDGWVLVKVAVVSQHHRSLRATPRSAPLLAEGTSNYLHVKMNIDDTEGKRVSSTGILAVFKRGCIKCGPADSQAKKMRIKTGVPFRNLIFFMMVTCVRGELFGFISMFGDRVRVDVCRESRIRRLENRSASTQCRHWATTRWIFLRYAPATGVACGHYRRNCSVKIFSCFGANSQHAGRFQKVLVYIVECVFSYSSGEMQKASRFPSRMHMNTFGTANEMLREMCISQ